LPIPTQANIDVAVDVYVPANIIWNARNELAMSTLEVPGAILHYETQGSGPVLVLIPGANGEAGIFQPLADALQDAFTVVRYDRRGFSDSRMTGAQEEGDRRLATDGRDVAGLLTHLGGAGTGFVFGNSSGAVVAMKFLLDHPNTAVKVIAHEPPSSKSCPTRTGGENSSTQLRRVRQRRHAGGDDDVV
jgi:pimeloyl-ACP methyl ester carboxylesterase